MISLDMASPEPEVSEPPNQMISLDINDILVSNEQEVTQQEPDNNVDLNTLLNIIP